MVVRRLYDYSTTIRREKLRLLQKLLRLFQPERCDYCWPLLAIGRKPEKRYGGSRQWFRTARRVPATGPYRCRWHGLRYVALPGIDPRQGRTAAPLYTLL